MLTQYSADTDVVLSFPALTVEQCDGPTMTSTEIPMTTFMPSTSMSSVCPDGTIASLDFEHLPCGPGDSDALPLKDGRYEPILALTFDLGDQPDSSWAHCVGEAQIPDPPISLKRRKDGINRPKSKSRP